MMFPQGYHLQTLELPDGARELALAGEWDQLDVLMARAVRERVMPELLKHKSFQNIEHMLALRKGDDPQEEEGIWHDDGSRVLAFSWSLNFFGMPQGGTLGVRPKGAQQGVELGPYPPGTLLVFHTGQDGFEHRTARVTQGQRLVCAGWCS